MESLILGYLVKIMVNLWLSWGLGFEVIGFLGENLMKSDHIMLRIVKSTIFQDMGLGKIARLPFAKITRNWENLDLTNNRYALLSRWLTGKGIIFNLGSRKTQRNHFASL